MESILAVLLYIYKLMSAMNLNLLPKHVINISVQDQLKLNQHIFYMEVANLVHVSTSGRLHKLKLATAE